MTWKKKRPDGVLVSMESVRLAELDAVLAQVADQIDQLLGNF
jgi:hypothetical protein